MIEIIQSFEKEVIARYKTENLIALQDNNFNYKGINVLEVSGFSSNSKRRIKGYKPVKNTWDIINCNSDLRYFTALLYLFRPYINNPGYENIKHDGKIIYTYFQSIEDHRYSQFASICFEKLYNYCDRIGDLLAYHYYDKFSTKEKIYFPVVVDKLKKDRSIESNEFFKKILTYRDTTFKEFNSERKEIVHNYQFETNYRFNFTINCTNHAEIKSLWNFKSSLPEFFKTHLSLANDLFYNTFIYLRNKHLP